MIRLRALVALALAISLGSAACGVSTGGGSDTEASTDAGPAPSEEPLATEAAQPEPDAQEDGSTADPQDDSDAGDRAEGSASSDSGDGEVSTTTAPAPAVSEDGGPEGSPDAAETDSSGSSPEAAALLSSVVTGLEGRSVRGEATVEAPIDTGPTGVLTTRFELDADGDLATTLEIPPGMDPDLPQGGETQFRYVGGEQYVMVPEPIAAAMGLDAGGGPVWLIVETSTIEGAPMQGGLGVLCVFPQMAEAPTSECDPVADASNLAAVAAGAVVVGREEVRGVETTRVSFVVPLLEMLGEALGDIPDDAAEMVDAEAFAGMFEELLSALEISAEVWIDDNSLIRRMSLDLSSMMGFPGAESDDLPAFSMTIEYYDFDADISVEAPPPEQVVGDTGLLG